MGVLSTNAAKDALEATATPRDEVVVVVDPCSSGRFYPYGLKALGFPIICVRSTRSVDPVFSKVYEAHKEYFVKTFDFENFDSLSSLVHAISVLACR